MVEMVLEYRDDCADRDDGQEEPGSGQAPGATPASLRRAAWRGGHGDEESGHRAGQNISALIPDQG